MDTKGFKARIVDSHGKERIFDNLSQADTVGTYLKTCGHCRAQIFCDESCKCEESRKTFPQVYVPGRLYAPGQLFVKLEQQGESVALVLVDGMGEQVSSPYIATLNNEGLFMHSAVNERLGVKWEGYRRVKVRT